VSGNARRFTGREVDAATGLQLNRWRFYHQQLGRWVSRDPIGYLGSEWNLYEYVENRPLTELDPTGEGLWQSYKDFWNRLWGNCSKPAKPKATYRIPRPKKPDPVYQTWRSYSRNSKSEKAACDALIKAYNLARKNKDGKTADHLGKVIATFCMK
jgi:RHS repeat-associated protein